MVVYILEEYDAEIPETFQEEMEEADEVIIFHRGKGERK